MEHRIVDTITRWVGASTLPLVVIAFVGGGFERGLGAIAGASLAVLNWLVIRWVVMAIVRRGERGFGLTAVLVAKIGFVLAGAAILLRIFDATGLILGVSALVTGLFGGALHLHFNGSLNAQDEGVLGVGERD
ncbi:hypothetical protein [Sandaracinus amylolyticus]|uniref:hypothetical protein n=1 Tax=Sandaracinus amylolyticus TaxID=927083 RepID=UPI001F272FF0|nr:hypothetical protein [Sandaracinus amylolyticus]UJR80090.1 Hypothetical protein I5071_21340 [Sandaracinus amylolyticus]